MAMNKRRHSNFYSYFIRSIFFGKNKQRLLLLAIMGLMLSSFALLVLQSTMGGLQKNLIARAQSYQGIGLIRLGESAGSLRERAQVLAMVQRLRRGLPQLKIYPEFELELLLRNQGFISPLIIHAYNGAEGEHVSFLGDHAEETILGVDLMQKVRATHGEEVQIISPGHTTMLMGDVPRTVTTTIKDSLATDVPEVDQLEAWTEEQIIFNLIRAEEYNLIRFFTEKKKISGLDKQKILDILPELTGRSPTEVQVRTWEEENESLVWALNMETTVMVALFVVMTLLVGISITSGLMIFFGKIQTDLVSFWILGRSRAQLEKMGLRFVHLLSFSAVMAGLLLALLFLYLLQTYGGDIMPDVFIERRIPVYITGQGLLLSLLIPYAIAALFSTFSFYQFRKDSRTFIEQLRS